MTRAAIIAGIALAAIAGTFYIGWSHGRATLLEGLAEAYQETIEEYDDADVPVDPDAVQHALCVLSGRPDCGDLPGVPQ